jgi:predicted DsbA family dithiol-disulfide isomerase
MGAEAGLTYKMANTLAGDTMDAHRVVHFAKSHGLQMQMVERLHRSHFAEEANIFDEDTLVRLAGEVGLDRNEIASILAGDMFKAGVEADEAAAQDVGASSVPFFLIDDRFPIQGSEARERIPAIMDRAWQAQAQRLSGHDKVFQPCRVVTAGNGRKWFRSAFRLTASPLPHIGSMSASSDSFCQSDIPLSTHFGHRNR